MGAILAGISSFALWFVAQAAAKIGVRLGIIAVVVACFTTIYGLMLAALGVIVALIPAHVFPSALTQFFPDAYALAIAGSAYWGSLVTKKSWDYWRLALSISVQVSS